MCTFYTTKSCVKHHNNIIIWLNEKSQALRARIFIQDEFTYLSEYNCQYIKKKLKYYLSFDSMGLTPV